MKNTVITLLITFLLSTFASATPVSKDAGNNIAVEGYDLVPFFTQSEAIKGDPTIRSELNGAVYFFSSEGNKALFEANPEKYLPAYGGYCAFGASINLLLPVDIETWEITDGRLVFQYSHDVRDLFNQSTVENIEKADAYWATLNKLIKQETR